jgi:hypothetical protein
MPIGCAHTMAAENAPIIRHMLEPSGHPIKGSRTEGTGMRIIGLDIHRAFADA